MGTHRKLGESSRGLTEIPLNVRLRPEHLEKVEAARLDLERRNPGLTFTRADAIRFIIGAWQSPQKSGHT